MTVICPFCGVVGAARHETQQACIGALQAEIARTRRVLEHVTELPPSASVNEEDEENQDKQLT